MILPVDPQAYHTELETGRCLVVAVNRKAVAPRQMSMKQKIFIMSLFHIILTEGGVRFIPYSAWEGMIEWLLPQPSCSAEVDGMSAAG